MSAILLCHCCSGEAHVLGVPVQLLRLYACYVQVEGGNGLGGVENNLTVFHAYACFGFRCDGIAECPCSCRLTAFLGQQDVDGGHDVLHVDVVIRTVGVGCIEVEETASLIVGVVECGLQVEHVNLIVHIRITHLILIGEGEAMWPCTFYRSR